MGDVNRTRADKLAAAKKLLKDFESKKQDRSSPASVVSSEPGGERRANSIPSPYLNGSELEWYTAYQNLKRQHDELTSHYSQLHSAYSQVTANGVHVDAENQISQLQAALSTLVEEKLQCSTELRKVNDEFAKFKIQVANKPEPETVVSQENGDSKYLKTQIQEKDKLLAARQQELETVRREAANFQATLLNVQHERSEAQARVKSLAREIAGYEQTVQQLRKDLQLKELYLKQLSAHSVTNVHPVDESSLKSLQEQIEQLTASNEALKEEKQRISSEIDNMRGHYTERENALLKKQEELSSQLEEIQSLRWAAEANVQQLKDELAISVMNKPTVENASVIQQHDEPSEPSLTEEDVVRRIRDAVRAERQQWQNREDAMQKERDDEMQNKDRTIFEKEQSLAELEMKYRLLEERTLVASEGGADLLLLSEQLQNEKATVSRAVAQNRELKQNLLDTEDRVVKLTEEKLSLELAKQSAEHELKELRRIVSGSNQCSDLPSTVTSPTSSNENLGLTLINSHNFAPSETHTCESIKDVDQLEEADVQNELRQENFVLQGQLNDVWAQLNQVRADLRRSNNHNEQMDQIMRQNAEDENQNSIHVELTQAVARISELAAENDQLRDEILTLREHAEQQRNVNEVELVESMDTSTPIEVNHEVVQDIEQDVNPEKNKENQTKDWAHQELEKRFARAMTQNAELTENIDKLEHINQQLQLENDTIADHVVLYHHQRRLMRERLRAKDEQLQTLEKERQRTVARCQELQQALMGVLSKGGILKEYEKRTPKTRKVRSYSHSTVDEMSGDEDVVVNASGTEVPSRQEDAERNKSIEMNGNILRPDSPISVTAERSESPDSVRSVEQDATVKRILELITDISKPPVLPASHLQCTQCIGDVQEFICYGLEVTVTDSYFTMSVTVFSYGNGRL